MKLIPSPLASARDIGTAPLDGLGNLGQSVVCFGQLYACPQLLAAFEDASPQNYILSISMT
jgi:hypothetical protein